jgi:CRP-like cAMP-binding protein
LLFQKFDEKIELTDEEKKLSRSFFVPKKLRKRQYLLQEGDVCKYIAFIEKGLLRSYTVDDKGNEHITSLHLKVGGYQTSIVSYGELQNTHRGNGRL